MNDIKPPFQTFNELELYLASIKWPSALIISGNDYATLMNKVHPSQRKEFFYVGPTKVICRTSAPIDISDIFLFVDSEKYQ